ncbi:MAG: P1 family peptidase, partial [Proteobacteria bacterium]|nr:P1 family peptidase [Pseudomonadota bacterium]
MDKNYGRSQVIAALMQGVRVGRAVDETVHSGVTVILPDEPAIAACHIMGGAPGTRDTELLTPENTVERVD